MTSTPTEDAIIAIDQAATLLQDARDAGVSQLEVNQDLNDFLMQALMKSALGLGLYTVSLASCIEDPDDQDTIRALFFASNKHDLTEAVRLFNPDQVLSLDTPEEEEVCGDTV